MRIIVGLGIVLLIINFYIFIERAGRIKRTIPTKFYQPCHKIRIFIADNAINDHTIFQIRIVPLNVHLQHDKLFASVLYKCFIENVSHR